MNNVGFFLLSVLFYNEIYFIIKRKFNYKKNQDRKELNPRRGALETPALPLSYGPKF